MASNSRWGNAKKVELFLKNKSNQYEGIEKFLRGFKAREFETKNINVLVRRKIRLDNAGENKRLEEILKEKGFDLKFEYTPVDRPKYNGVVERDFAKMYGRVRAMLNAGGSFGDNPDKFWEECALTAAKLDDILAYKSGTPASFFEDGKKPGYADFLHPFGELGVLAKGGKKKPKAKLRNISDVYFFAGYTENHSEDVF